jgi:type I restriction enzyme S subunit
VGSTVGHLNLGDFRKLAIALPSIQEQIKCGQILESLDQKQLGVQQKLANYKSMKKALMQDLLTGKVRVNTELSNSSLAVG